MKLLEKTKQKNRQKKQWGNGEEVISTMFMRSDDLFLYHSVIWRDVR